MKEYLRMSRLRELAIHLLEKKQTPSVVGTLKRIKIRMEELVGILV